MLLEGLQRGDDSHGEVTITEAMQMALGWHRDGRVRTAAEVYRRILAHNPDHADALHFLGVALHQLGQSANGAALLRRALDLVPDYAEASNNLGNVLKEMMGDLAGAEEAYRRALELCPGNTDTLNNLGVVLKERGLLDDAVTTFERALALNPRHADLWHNLGNTLKKLCRIDEALTAYRQAITLKPYHTEAYRNLGRMLYIAGRSAEAVEVYRQWHAHDPENHVARHLLAACSREDVPEMASDAYDAAIDSFATSFDDVMSRLNYRAPALVLEAVRHAYSEPTGALSVLDAGCGTGMCGSLLRPYASHLTGVDLSRGMLDRARGSGVYDDLAQAELIAYLARQVRRFDLIVSVDILCYFGELGAVVTAAAGVLRPGGWFVFTLEAGEDDA